MNTFSVHIKVIPVLLSFLFLIFATYSCSLSDREGGNNNRNGGLLSDAVEDNRQFNYDENGFVIGYGPINEGVEEGAWIGFNENGNISTVYNLKDNTPDGGYIYFDEDGNIVQTGIIKNSSFFDFSNIYDNKLTINSRQYIILRGALYVNQRFSWDQGRNLDHGRSLFFGVNHIDPEDIRVDSTIKIATGLITFFSGDDHKGTVVIRNGDYDSQFNIVDKKEIYEKKVDGYAIFALDCKFERPGIHVIRQELVNFWYINNIYNESKMYVERVFIVK